MVCVLRKHKYKIIKMIFHTDLQLVSCSHDKSIIFWELQKLKNSKGEDYYIAKDFLKINSPIFYIDIAIT